MGFPTVRNISSGQIGNVISMAIPLPTALSGDLLFMIVSVDGSRTFAAVSGWTQLAQSNATGQNSLGIWYKTATGSDTNPTVNWGARESGTYAVIAYTTGTYTGNPVISTVASGTSVNPNSASLTTGWGAVNTRFISVVGTDAITSVTTQPTNYTVVVDISTTTAQGASISTSKYDVLAASNDPDVYTMNTSEQWIAYTVAIQGTETTTPTLKVNIGGVWKTAEMFVNVGGVWKPVDNIETNIGGTWKTWTS